MALLLLSLALLNAFAIVVDSNSSTEFPSSLKFRKVSDLSKMQRVTWYVDVGVLIASILGLVYLSVYQNQGASQYVPQPDLGGGQPFLGS